MQQSSNTYTRTACTSFPVSAARSALLLQDVLAALDSSRRQPDRPQCNGSQGTDAQRNGRDLLKNLHQQADSRVVGHGVRHETLQVIRHGCPLEIARDQENAWLPP